MTGIEVKKKLQNNGFSLKMVADLMGETPQNLNSMLNAQDIKTGTVEKIAKAINKSLYFFFEEKIESKSNLVPVFSDNIAIYKSKKTKEKLVERQLIPIYNIDAAAGLVSLFNDAANYTPIDYIYLPHLGKVDGGLFASGDSMYPLIKSGDIVVYRQMHDIINSIFWGEMYLLSYDLEGEEYIVIKYIQKSDREGYVTLASHNQHHQPKDVPIAGIRALAQVKASVRYNIMRNA